MWLTFLTSGNSLLLSFFVLLVHVTTVVPCFAGVQFESSPVCVWLAERSVLTGRVWQAGSRATSARSAKDEDADLAPPLQANNLKRQRVADEMKLKVRPPQLGD